MKIPRKQQVTPRSQQATATDAAVADLRRSRGRALFSVGVNGALALGKGVAGVMSGSSALIGDAIHSATDVVGSTAAVIGLWLAGRRHPDFPYGLYKAETIAALITSVTILLAGYEIARSALLGGDTLPSVSLALPVTVIAFLVTLAFGIFQIRSGRRLGSPALSADGRDYLVDSISTGLVLVSLIGVYFGLSLDKWASLGVAGFIFWSGGGLLLSSLRDLLDEAIDRDMERDIIRTVEQHPRVERVEQLLSRTAGGRYLVDLDVVLRTGSHELANKVAAALENDIKEGFPHVVMARIKTRAHGSDFLRRLRPVQHPGGPIEQHLAKAPWFRLEIIDRNSGQTTQTQHLENPHISAETKRGFLVGRWLLSQNPDELIVQKKKEGTTVALLEEAGVDVMEEEAVS